VRSGSTRRNERSRWLAAATIAAWTFVAGSFLPPVLTILHRGGGPTLDALYSPLCHQSAARSFQIGGQRIAVCARCLGAYAGGALGLSFALLGLVLRGDRRVWLALAAAPCAVDVGLRMCGAPGAGNALRALLALPPGLVAGLLLAEGIADLARRPSWSTAIADGRNR
jgi:uncharacterized membrane protein